MSVKVSFVIPHKGRESMLLETLESIENQCFSEGEIEVILVSQNASVSGVLSSFKDKINLNVIFTSDENTISYSRNKGAEEATGEFIAFLDADVQLADNWTSTMYSLLVGDPENALISAMQINSNDAPPLEKIRTALSNAELDTHVAFLPGRNLFLSKATFDKVGGFPEHLATCEDYYFTDKVSQFGKLYYTSKAHYVHIGEDKAFVPMFKKEIWRGQSNLASLAGRNIGLREWPSFIVPFAVTGGVVFGLLFALFLDNTLGALFLISGAVPLIAYTARLKNITGPEVNVIYCFWFYLLYFPARTIGTLLGVRGAVTTSSHN